MDHYTSQTTPLETSAGRRRTSYDRISTNHSSTIVARFNWHQAFSNASYETYPLEYDYAAFEPTHRIRSWGMVRDDNPLSANGRDNLLDIYTTVVRLWGDVS
jgi:hypothetical protein